jgi:hypothetical protein
MANADTTAGGWTDFNFTLSEQDTAIFKQAVLKPCTPLAVSHRMGEDEVNYCFLSKGKMTTNQPDETAYLIYIYQPPRGDAVVGDIKQVEPSMSS